MSPCAKSKRGVVVYRVAHRSMFGVPMAELMVGSGHNGPPPGVTCDGSDACRASCRHRCEHAESRALLWAMTKLDALTMTDFHSCDLVHVKVGTEGDVVAGGGPSCVPCAVRILDVGIGGVWLYEMGVPDDELVEASQRGIAVPMRPFWHRYTAVDFHRISCAANGVY